MTIVNREKKREERGKRDVEMVGEWVGEGEERERRGGKGEGVERERGKRKGKRGGKGEGVASPGHLVEATAKGPQHNHHRW